MKKRVIFISSTGGHFSELMMLKPIFDNYDFHLITEKTKSNLSLKDKFDKVYYLVYGTKKNLFTYFFKFSFNIIKSLYYFLKIRPSVIVTTGTHTAVPMCYIAKLFKSKVIFIETFANSKTKTVDTNPYFSSSVFSKFSPEEYNNKKVIGLYDDNLEKFYIIKKIN